MILTKKQEELANESWKKKSALQMSLSFVAAIQLPENQRQIKSQLKRVENLIESEDKLVEGQDPEPRDSDFVDVTYRALSAVMLSDRPIDFSNEPMMKRGVKLLDGQTVFKDHNTNVDNWVGRVKQTFWDAQTKDFPPGINAVLSLDAVKDPMTVRGVLLGALHSVSVTVMFEWKPSHPSLMDQGSFFENLGEEVEGDIVRVVVTKIERFTEISLVWQGADMYAKQIKDGKATQKALSLEPEDVTETETLASDSDQEESCVESLSDSNSKLTVSSNQEDEMNKFLELLKAELGADVTEENFKAELDKYFQTRAEKMKDAALVKAKEQQVEIENLSKTVTELEDKLSKKDEKIQEMKPEAALGTQYLKDCRAEAVRLCKLAKGEEVNEAILKTLETSNLEVVRAWTSEFEKEVNDKFPSICGKCGSKEISKRSSQATKEELAESEDNVYQLNSEVLSSAKNLHV